MATSELALSIGSTELNTRSGLGAPSRRKAGPVTMATTPKASPDENIAVELHLAEDKRGRGGVRE